MTKWTLTTVVEMTAKETWIVEADTLGEAIEKLLGDGDDAEYVEQEMQDDEHNRRVIAGKERDA